MHAVKKPRKGNKPVCGNAGLTEREIAGPAEAVNKKINGVKAKNGNKGLVSALTI